jgi:hypothetical protein
MAKITKKHLIAEMIKCGRDPLYFINTYAKIQHPVKGLIPFNMFDYQQDVVDGFLKNRFNIILKGRQLGLTTTMAGYIAWFILFHRDKNVLVVATKQDVAKNVIRMIRNIFKYVPVWMMDIGKAGGSKKENLDNRHSIEMANGSRVSAVTTTDNVGRTEAVSLLVLDEVAHIKNMEQIWVGLWPTVSTGGSVVLLSTPNGTGNFFHKQYTQAQNGENNFNCKFGTYTNPQNPNESYDDRLMWWVHPEHDDAWFVHETAGKSPREIAQEYLCNFNASGDTFIWHEDIVRLEEIIQHQQAPGIFHLDRNVWVWEPPKKNAQYLISCDVSRGDAQDYSAFHVIRLDGHPLVQVAEYKGKIRPDQLGMLLVSVSQMYNNAMIAPENNSGWSGQTILKIQEANHPFLYYSRRRKPRIKNPYMPDPYYAERRNDYLPGYAVTSANRLPMLAKLEQYVRMGDIVINSQRTVDEFKTFIVTETNRPEAQRGMNDDLVMALAGGLWVRDEAFMYTYRTDDVTKAMLDGMSISNTPTKHFRDFDFDNSLYDRNRIKEHVENQNKIVMGNGDVVDLNWLIQKG